MTSRSTSIIFATRKYHQQRLLHHLGRTRTRTPTPSHNHAYTRTLRLNPSSDWNACIRTCNHSNNSYDALSTRRRAIFTNHSMRDIRLHQHIQRAYVSSKKNGDHNDDEEDDRGIVIEEHNKAGNEGSLEGTDHWRPDWRERVLESHREMKQAVKIAETHIQNERKNKNHALANVQRALIGNLCIAAAKLGAWASCGSSALLSEFIHSVVDCGNQALLLIGLRESESLADRRHPYGYGKSVYFWSLVSALGTFWLGAGVSFRHSVEELFDPSLAEITWHVWGVLGFSLAVDGWVLWKTLQNLNETKPADKTLWRHLRTLRDPTTLAVVLEDGAACAGVVVATAGLCMTQMTGLPIYDGAAGVGISLLLGGMGLALARVNQKFLLGQTVDSTTLKGVEDILMRQPAIDNVHSVQSQWIGPSTFSYKAEVDIDGTYLAAKLLPRYQKEFLKSQLDQELKVLLSWYAEDVMRTVERGMWYFNRTIRCIVRMLISSTFHRGEND